MRSVRPEAPRSRRRVLALFAACVAAATFALLPASSSAIVAGAGYSTSLSNADCVHGTLINCNTYGSKLDVYVSGGPTAGGIKTAGTYFFAIIEPGSQNTFLAGGAAGGDLSLCGNDPVSERTFVVALDGGGNPVIDSYAGTTHDAQNQAESPSKYVVAAGDPGNLFCDTSNSGGVYILAICSAGATSPSQCKFDAFRVSDSETPPTFGTVSGMKYYDANLNGQLDSGEQGIGGWPINYADGIPGTLVTDSSGSFSGSFVADTYTFTEQQSTNTKWYQTGNTVDQTSDSGGNSSSLSSFVYTVTVVDGGETTGVNFGNVCKVVSAGGRTMGYWANNGNSSITASDLAALTALNLVSENGSAFNPSTAGQIKTFLNGAMSVNAKNMAFMLSGQIVALYLNVAHGFLNGSDTVLKSDGTPFGTIDQIISWASTSIGSFPITTTKVGTSERPWQEKLKNYADGLNQNNGLLVVPGSLSSALTRCGAPTFA